MPIYFCTEERIRTFTSLRHQCLKLARLPFRHFGILHTRTDSNRRQKFWRFLCYHYTTGMCVVIPEGFEPPHLLVRSEMFYPIKLRNHFLRKRRESNPQAFYSQLISSQCPRPFGPLPYLG